ncbi:hypothetical protein QRX60_29330 [Amycolatopsis mongoliensis]|uniref:Uncharacterized protein n=1 Tax=Amycolatopsis mongoliensis TaxID=715475 RepID=A0A9Y2NDZ8_9PSEU|nr:hypothetical protein [Amycolatopsis sp. 4-36]WIX98168.1 hypothetical protein QRX60_29330 [Amycolatopsis sp. 4-36]
MAPDIGSPVLGGLLSVAGIPAVTGVVPTTVDGRWPASRGFGRNMRRRRTRFGGWFSPSAMVVTTTAEPIGYCCAYFAADRRCFRPAPNGRRRIIRPSAASISIS